MFCPWMDTDGMTDTATVFDIAASEEVAEQGRLVVDIGSASVGVFRFKGQVYAYRNICPHQGGPACQGRIINRVREDLNEQKMSQGLSFDKDVMHIVCPWHGLEFNVTTGIHPGDPAYKLRALEVVETDGRIHVTL